MKSFGSPALTSGVFVCCFPFSPEEPASLSHQEMSFFFFVHFICKKSGVWVVEVWIFFLFTLTTSFSSTIVIAHRPQDKRCYSPARRGQGRAARTECEKKNAAFTASPVCGFTKKKLGSAGARVLFALRFSASVVLSYRHSRTLHFLACT